MHNLLPRVLLAVLACFGLSIGFAVAEVPSSGLVCLVTISTKVSVPNPEKDLQAIKDLFESGCKEANVPLAASRLIVGPFDSENRFHAALESHGGPSELSKATLVCYLKLHGGTGRQQHLMRVELTGAQKDLWIPRERIVELLRRQKAARTILITDSCSEQIAPFSPETGTVAGYKFPTLLFRGLFLDGPDLVNINSSTFEENGKTLNQLAWMDEEGAVFTRALVDCFRPAGKEQEKMLEDMQKRGSFTWRDFYPILRERTDARFQEFKGGFRGKFEANGSPSEWESVKDRIDKQPHQFPKLYAPAP
jgi:hypothetical protein